MPSSTIIVTQDEDTKPIRPERVVIYARVSSRKQLEDLGRQVRRLLDFCAAKGYHVARVVKAIGSGLHDGRLKFLALLKDPSITLIVVEHQDRATRFGFRYLDTLLTTQERRIKVVNEASTNRQDLLAD